MHVLITNDDGVTAPGLSALVDAFSKEWQVSVLAPDRNWSASGHVKTMHRPLRVWETELADGTPALTTNGAPSDSVALAVLGIIKEPIDLVVSGINPFANLGHDVTYSGTVTAAMEAVISGLPGVAVSLDSDDRQSGKRNYKNAASLAFALVKQVMAYGFPPKTLLNMNIPEKEINGVKITLQGQRIYRDALVERQDPRGRTYYWIGGDSPTGVTDHGTDFRALSEGYISITPLHLDLTAHSRFPELQAWEFDLQVD
jgi:5'-nucleotidase